MRLHFLLFEGDLIFVVSSGRNLSQLLVLLRQALVSGMVTHVASSCVGLISTNEHFFVEFTHQAIV